MSLATAIALLLALGAVLAMARIAWRGWRTAGARAPAPAWLALLALQPLVAWLLWQALFPPTRARPQAELVVATAGTPPSAIVALAGARRVVALPEAPALPGVARVPDLASALRARPATALRVLGQGLPARDRDAARGLPLRFDAAPLPRGLVALWRDEVATVGRPFRLAGAAAGLPGGRARLRDPGGATVAGQPLDAAGAFVLQAIAPVAGTLDYALELVDAGGRVVAREALPLRVRDGIRPRLLALAGGPDPEWKYLRRWAVDAGLPLRTRIALGAGVQAGEPVALDAAALRDADLVLLDERAWRGLDAGRRALLRTAVRDGLGLVLRATGPLDAATRADWRALGIALQPAAAPAEVALPPDWLERKAPARGDALARVDADVAADAGDAADAGGALGDATGNVGVDEASRPTRAPLRAEGAALRPLLADARGRALGAWRGVGAGRVGVLWLGDTWRLVLAGEDRAHARVWSEVVGTLSRARAPASPRLQDGPARVGQRAVLCAPAGPWSVLGPDAEALPFAARRAGAGECLVFWPARPGWHAVRAGDGTLDLRVLEAAALPGLRARADRDATAALAAASPRQRDTAAHALRVPGPRWPWALGWLALAALGWLLERRVLATPAPVVVR